MFSLNVPDTQIPVGINDHEWMQDELLFIHCLGISFTTDLLYHATKTFFNTCQK